MLEVKDSSGFDIIETAPGTVSVFRVLRSLICLPNYPPSPIFFHHLSQPPRAQPIPGSRVLIRTRRLFPAQRSSAPICGKGPSPRLRASVVSFKVLLFQFSLFGNFGDFGNLSSQLHHLNPLRALRPVVHPAHDHVALLRVVPVPQEILALAGGGATLAGTLPRLGLVPGSIITISPMSPKLSFTGKESFSPERRSTVSGKLRKPDADIVNSYRPLCTPASTNRPCLSVLPWSVCLRDGSLNVTYASGTGAPDGSTTSRSSAAWLRLVRV